MPGQRHATPVPAEFADGPVIGDPGPGQGNQALIASLNGYSGESASSSMSGAGTSLLDRLNPWNWGGEAEKPQKLKKMNIDPRDFLPEWARDDLDERDAFDKSLAEEEGADSNRFGYRRAAFRIGQGYLDTSPTEDGSAAVDLSSPEARRAALDGFTQNYTSADGMTTGDGTSPGTNRCGATSVMAGAMLAGGNEGVDAIIDSVMGDEDDTFGDREAMGPIREKIAKGGTLTKEDLRQVQSAFHSHLQRQTAKAGQDDGSQGVSGGAVHQAIRDNPKLAAMFDANDMQIALLDNTGDDQANHFALRMDGGASYYDPYARRDGQLIEGSATEDYDLARSKHPLLGGQ